MSRLSRYPVHASVYVDGQNLFHAAKEAFGYSYPNYDIRALSKAVCRREGWGVGSIYFYTGVPAESDNPFWSHFWAAKLGAMGHEGIHTFSRPLRYNRQSIQLPDGTRYSVRSGQEKGIDVRLALDMVRNTTLFMNDAVVIFSQDQDLSEAVREVRRDAAREKRSVEIVSAYPVGPTSRNARGINGTRWIPINRWTYSRCLDPTDYQSRSLAA